MHAMLDNVTPFAAEILPSYGVDGEALRIVVVKATLDLHARVVPHGRELPVLHSDLFFEEAELRNDVRMEGDAVPTKPRVDVIVNAFAYPPGGRPVPWFDAGVRIGQQARAVRVFGPRAWHKHLGVFAMASEPSAALRVPLIYSLAFGGHDPADPRSFAQQNPTGLGFSTGSPPHGLALPQIEWPDALIRNPSDQPAPAGFGCIGRTWQPRRGLLGSYTPSELQGKGIVRTMPRSFDPAAWNCAHPRMQFSRDEVRDGTVIEWVHLSVGGRAQFVLPQVRLSIAWTAAGQTGSASPPFDTVCIEPEHGHCVLVWRCVLPPHHLDAVCVHV